MRRLTELKNGRRALLFLLLAAVLFTACGKKNEKPTVAVTDIVFHPCTGEVTIGQYKGLKMKIEVPAVTDADIDRQIKEFLAVRPNYVEDLDRAGDAVKKGDFVNIDFVGTVNGEPFEGGSSQGYDLEIGSKTLISGFEEGLIGSKPGETVTVDATFPETYTRQPSLAGVTAQFEVTINYISKKADYITDEYVAKNSRSYKTVEDFRKFVKENLEKDAREKAEEEAGLKLLDEVVNASKFGEIPEADIQYYYRRLIAPYESYAQQSGLELSAFLKLYTDYSSAEELYARSREMALDSVKQFMVLQKIAEAENITVSDEEYEEYVTGVRTEGGYADNASVEQLFGKDFLTYSKQMEKALAFIADNAVRE